MVVVVVEKEDGAHPPPRRRGGAAVLLRTSQNVLLVEWMDIATTSPLHLLLLPGGEWDAPPPGGHSVDCGRGLWDAS